MAATCSNFRTKFKHTKNDMFEKIANFCRQWEPYFLNLVDQICPIWREKVKIYGIEIPSHLAQRVPDRGYWFRNQQYEPERIAFDIIDKSQIQGPGGKMQEVWDPSMQEESQCHNCKTSQPSFSVPSQSSKFCYCWPPKSGIQPALPVLLFDTGDDRGTGARSLRVSVSSPPFDQKQLNRGKAIPKG